MAKQRYQTILLVGAPGAGKGTQGKILGQIPGFFHLSCGEVFRTIDIHSELGKVFYESSSRGELVKDLCGERREENEPGRPVYPEETARRGHSRRRG